MRELASESSAQLRLKCRLKNDEAEDCSLTRVRPIQDTLATIIPVCKEIGVTRISDITFMDRLYIPNYSATLPGTDDVFWVYGGKGTTNFQAKASALMESIERYSSLFSTNPRSTVNASYLHLSKSYNSVLHPAEVIEPVDLDYDEADPLDYIAGFDLLNNEEILVPAEIAFYRYFPKPPAVSVFSCSHTNGLASGNVLEEAICHALCEIIERDAVSIADLCASCIPYNIVEKMGESLKAVNHLDSESFDSLGDRFVDDPTIFPDVEIAEATEFEPIKCLVKKFTGAGIPLMIKDITQKDIRIPTIVASSIEWMTHDYGLFAKGYGTHPDAKVALIRAITEVSQTRAANIQGARDDLKRIQYKEKDEIYKRKWPFMPSSSFKEGQTHGDNIKNFSEIGTNVNKDILDDIELILSVLREAGIRRVIIVNLTNPNIGIPVVRAIVPGLEAFEVTQSVIGRRAKKWFNRLFDTQLR
jgi:thioglycine synthase